MDATTQPTPFNRDSERAIINLLSPEFQASIVRAYLSHGEFFGLGEKELKKLIYDRDLKIVATDNQLRMKFWYEYDLAQDEGRRVKTNAIYSGVCDEAYFFRGFLSKPHKLAWLMTKPADYEIATREAHLTALDKIRSALEVEPVDGNGKLNVKVAELQLKIFQMLDLRVKGAVIQKTMNVHATVGDRPSSGSEKTSKEDLERRLADLEKLREKSRGKIIDASPVTIE